MLAAPNSGLLNQLYRDLTGAAAGAHFLNIYSFPGLVFVISCYTFPYVFVLIANALDRTPGDLEDASAILGGKSWDTTRRIAIPLALPALVAGALVAFLEAMTQFGAPAILGDAGRLPHHDHQNLEPVPVSGQARAAAAASLPLLILTVILLRAQHMVLGRRGYAVVGGKTSEPRIVRSAVTNGWRSA